MRKLFPDFPYTEIQLKWLKVLENRDRGFRPKQVIGALRSADCGGFCCLGVASQIMIKLGLVEAGWNPQYDDESYEEDMETLLPDAVPVGHYELQITGSSNTDEEVLPVKIQEMLNLRANDGSSDFELENATEYPNGYLSPVVDGRNYDFCPDGLADLNDGGVSFINIAVMIRMFPHFYFDNGGDPTEAIYRADIFDREFKPSINRARYFE